MNTPGRIDILNCADGHTEIHVSQGDALEQERDKTIITDMLRRGYSLFVHGEGNALERVLAYDPAKHVYIVAAPSMEPLDSPLPVTPRPDPLPEPKRRGRPKREVPVPSAHVTAIARTAGG